MNFLSWLGESFVMSIFHTHIVCLLMWSHKNRIYCYHNKITSIIPKYYLILLKPKNSRQIFLLCQADWYSYLYTLNINICYHISDFIVRNTWLNYNIGMWSVGWSQGFQKCITVVGLKCQNLHQDTQNILILPELTRVILTVVVFLQRAGGPRGPPPSTLQIQCMRYGGVFW